MIHMLRLPLRPHRLLDLRGGVAASAVHARPRLVAAQRLLPADLLPLGHQRDLMHDPTVRVRHHVPPPSWAWTSPASTPAPSSVPKCRRPATADAACGSGGPAS